MQHESDSLGKSEILVIQVFRGESEVERKAFSIKEKVTIGRDPYTDIAIEDPTVSRLHAEILREGDNLVLYDRSSNGVRVNGRSTPRHELRSGDVLSVGRFRVLIELHCDSKSSLYDEAHAEGWDLDNDQTISVSRKPSKSLKHPSSENVSGKAVDKGQGEQRRSIG